MFLVDWIDQHGIRMRQDHDDEPAAEAHATRLVRAGATRATYYEVPDPPPDQQATTTTPANTGVASILEDE